MKINKSFTTARLEPEKRAKAKIEAVKIVTGNNCSDIDALNLFEGRINNKGTNEEKENDKKI